MKDCQTKLNKPTGKIKRRGDSLSNSHTIIKGFDWFLLWHLKPSWPCIQQVGCSSAEGLVVRGVGWGRDLALGGGVGSKGWRMGLGLNAKTINPTSAWPQVPIKFIYIFTLRTPLKCLCLDISKQHDMPIYLATKRSEDRELGPVYPTLTWRAVSSYPPLFKVHSKDLLLIAGLCREFLFIIPGIGLSSSPAGLSMLWGIEGLLTFFTLCLKCLPHVIPTLVH